MHQRRGVFVCTGPLRPKRCAGVGLGLSGGGQRTAIHTMTRALHSRRRGGSNRPMGGGGCGGRDKGGGVKLLRPKTTLHTLKLS